MPKSPLHAKPQRAKKPTAPPSQGWEATLDVLNAYFPTHPMGDVCGGDPFKVLVGCIISLRTKDEVTIPACQRLFPIAATPSAMAQLPLAQLEQLIYPAGFYKTKAQTILDISALLAQPPYHGQVPNTIEGLLVFKGVGRKTANLVVGLGHRLPAICVDVHVHRIAQRLGWLQTATPDETEMALRERLPLPYWDVINRIMVMHGRDICKPVSPWCDVCPVATSCPQVGVKPRKPPKEKEPKGIETP